MFIPLVFLCQLPYAIYNRMHGSVSLAVDVAASRNLGALLWNFFFGPSRVISFWFTVLLCWGGCFITYDNFLMVSTRLLIVSTHVQHATLSIFSMHWPYI